MVRISGRCTSTDADRAPVHPPRIRPRGRGGRGSPGIDRHDRVVEADGEHVLVLGQRQAGRAVLQPRPAAPPPDLTVMTICRSRRRGYRSLSPQSGKQQLLPERCISVMGRPCWPVTHASATGSGGDDFGGERAESALRPSIILQTLTYRTCPLPESTPWRTGSGGRTGIRSRKGWIAQRVPGCLAGLRSIGVCHTAIGAVLWRLGAKERADGLPGAHAPRTVIS